MSLLGWIVAILAVKLLLAALGIYLLLRARNMQIWIWQYLKRKPRPPVRGPTHVMFCFVDHFEPMWGKADAAQQRARVQRWVDGYRAMASRHRDADGRAPQHSFFYPEEEYVAEHLDQLQSLCADGYGEIEVHLHHDNDNEANFRATLDRFCKLLHERHGSLPRDPVTGEIRYAFIHGNWCLDNSRGDGRWCGINNELVLLRETGCYADFTLPSAPSDTQTSTVNSIYYATDDPARPKSHDRGVPVRVGGAAQGDLMIVQGPLALNWKQRRAGIVPRIENSDVREANPPSPSRVDAWVQTGIHVQGRPDWVFVKVHTHGTQERDIETLLGPPTDAMHTYLERRYNDGRDFVLHYVTARECYNIIKAAEAGKSGNPNDYRDFALPPPPLRTAEAAGRERQAVAS